MPDTKKKLKPCRDHFLVLRDEARRNFVFCDKCGFKLPCANLLRSVRFENRYFFDH